MWALPIDHHSGRLTANLIGGYVIGLAVGAINLDLGLSLQARLFLMTGFCGGLTTFSTFSAETFALLSRGQIAWGLGEIDRNFTARKQRAVANTITYSVHRNRLHLVRSVKLSSVCEWVLVTHQMRLAFETPIGQLPAVIGELRSRSHKWDVAHGRCPQALL
jgi:protein CrcB